MTANRSTFVFVSVLACVFVAAAMARGAEIGEVPGLQKPPVQATTAPSADDLLAKFKKGNLLFTATVKSVKVMAVSESVPPTRLMRVEFKDLKMVRGTEPASKLFRLAEPVGGFEMTEGAKVVVAANDTKDGRYFIAAAEASDENLKLAAKAAEATTKATTQPTSGPASKPAEISQDDAKKIAEAELKIRKIDVSKMNYCGVHEGDLPGGRKCWTVTWAPKQPAPQPGRPVAMIMGGQIMVKVTKDTGEASMAYGM